MPEEEEMKSAQMKNYKYLLCLFAMRLCQSAPESIDKTEFDKEGQIAGNIITPLVDIRKSVETIH